MRKGDRETGASAVEFALVAPLLLLLVFGIISVGAWMFEYLAAKNAVEQGSRYGVTAVGGVPPVPCAASGSLAEDTACVARGGPPDLSADRRIRVYATGKDGAAGVWESGGTVTVCYMARVPVIRALPVPFPDTVKARSTLRVEESAAAPVGAFQDTAPPGDSWSWC